MVLSIKIKRKPEKEDILEDEISMPEGSPLSDGTTPSEKEMSSESKEEWSKKVIEEIEKETRSR